MYYPCVENGKHVFFYVIQCKGRFDQRSNYVLFTVRNPLRRVFLVAKYHLWTFLCR